MGRNGNLSEVQAGSSVEANVYDLSQVGHQMRVRAPSANIQIATSSFWLWMSFPSIWKQKQRKSISAVA